MNTRKLQGRAPTLRDHHRAIATFSANYGAVDFDGLRDTLNARQFVGPPTPLHLRRELQPDVLTERERNRYWQLVAEFNRYGQALLKQRGTPFAGDAFGYGH